MPNWVDVGFRFGEPHVFVVEHVERVNSQLQSLDRNERHGIGVTLDSKALTQIGDYGEVRPSNVYSRPDGSLTHW